MVGRCTVWYGGALCGRAVHCVVGRCTVCYTVWRSGVLCDGVVY